MSFLAVFAHNDLGGQDLTRPQHVFILPNMMDMSPRQRKAAEKIKRLREYFSGQDSPLIYEWTPSDEELDFVTMSDEDVAEYLKPSS